MGLLALFGLGAGRRAQAGPLADWWRERAAARGGPQAASGNSHRRGEKGRFELPAGATLDADLSYGNDPAHKLDVYRPARVVDGGLVVMVHGGGWAQGDKALWRTVRNKVEHWVGAGKILVSVNYRKLPQADPISQAGDVARALAFVQRRARDWGADPAGIVLVGHSAGAHLVALITADPSLGRPHGLGPWRASISLDSAAYDIERIMRGRHLGLYDRAFGDDPAYWRAASPTHRLAGPPAAPMLLVCSSRRSDSCDQAQAFVDRALSFGGRASVLPVDLSHADINDMLGAPGAYTESVDRFLGGLLRT